MESMINYVHEKLKKLGAERLMDNAPVKLKGIGVAGLMTKFQEKIKTTGADSMTQTKLKGMGAVSISLMKNAQEKLNKTTDRYEVVNYLQKKFGWDLKNMTDNAKLKGIGAVTSLMTNFQEKIKKTGADSMMQMKLKGMGAVSVSLMKNVQEKLKKTTDQYEVVNYLQKKYGWDLKTMTDNAKIATKQSRLNVGTEFIITFIALLVVLVFLLGCIHCCKRTAGKMMKAPRRRSIRIFRHKFESNPRSYLSDLRGKEE